MVKKSMRNALIGYAFLLPNILGFLLFTFGPIFYSFAVSFFDWNLFSFPVFIDIGNFLRIFFSSDSNFWSYFGNTFFFVIVVPWQMGIALAAAYLLNENLRGSVIFKILFFIPVVLSVVSISMVWGYILDYENGLLNQMLALLHLGKVSWLYEPQWVKIGIGMVVVWQGSAFNTIIYYAALQGIPEDLYEAATIDGAGRFRKFWRITVPLLGPYHLFLLVTGLIGALQLFAPIHVMTHGVPAARNIIYEIYWKAYHEFEMGYASALSWVLFLLIFAVSAIYWKFIGKRVHYS